MRTSKHHHTLTNGKGKCSVPMWCAGLPAGFCDADAFGNYIDTKERYPEGPHRGQRMDNKFDGYVPGLACPAHGGPPCPGIEIEPGVFSGCDTSKVQDCPICCEDIPLSDPASAINEVREDLKSLFRPAPTPPEERESDL